MEKEMENEMETRDYMGLYWDNRKENGNYYLGFRGLEFRI